MRKIAFALALAALFLGIQLAQVQTAAAKASKAQAVKITDGTRVEAVGDNSAVIAWTTNVAASSVVRYGTDRNHLDRMAESPYTDKTHRVDIKGLKPNTTYFFVADSGQGKGTGTEAKSAVAQFATKAQGAKTGEQAEKAEPLKIINGPRVEGVGPNWAVVAWTTNTGSSSIVRYGTDRNQLSQTAQSPYADTENATHETHRVRLQNLKPKSTYYFVADSGQGEGTGGEVKSPVGVFKTK